GAGCESSIEGQLVAIAPGENAVFPVQIEAIPVRKEESGLEGKVGGCCRDHTVFQRSIGCGDIAVAGFEDQKPLLRVVQIKGGHFFKLDQRLHIELNTRTDCKLILITTVSIVL